ncbi:MAG: hypothetical protein KF880_04305 [Ferruginibacter sp.]|nr:hypothetical protein [Ferruginibacter sp.]
MHRVHQAYLKQRVRDCSGNRGCSGKPDPTFGGGTPKINRPSGTESSKDAETIEDSLSVCTV